MNINIVTEQGIKSIRLEDCIIPARQCIWIGAPTENVYNSMPIDGVHTFQCTITYNKGTDSWTLSHGQVRTLCHRGIKSERSRACNMCRGCCGYIHTANPDYALRLPENAITLLNGTPVTPEGTTLNEGDTISFA